MVDQSQRNGSLALWEYAVTCQAANMLQFIREGAEGPGAGSFVRLCEISFCVYNQQTNNHHCPCYRISWFSLLTGLKTPEIYEN